MQLFSQTHDDEHRAATDTHERSEGEERGERGGKAGAEGNDCTYH